ncbi:helix-turn-helix domain-containing protein [Rhodobacteraceae bacterium]|nr:helix-turn-helix domain-containing protein [Paracoccaceae bacterium]
MPNTKHIAILIYPGFSALCLANAVEPLRAANTLGRSTLYSWAFLGGSGQPILSSSGLPVQPEAFGAQTGDLLLVMPSYGHLDHDTPKERRQLRAAADRFSMIAGLDTGSWLLAAAGLFDGVRATSHWDTLTAFEEAFPEVHVTTDRFVIDGNRASCGGATTTLELMLELIERHQGAALALEVAALFMYGERNPATDPNRLLSHHQTVRAAAAIMRRHLENPVKIGAIAGELSIGQRALELAFQSHLGQTPARLYRRIRLSEARRRLEQTRESVTEIAQRCGYDDPSAMARAYRAEFDQTPSATRRAVVGSRR